MADLTPGVVLAGCRIQRLLGRGGMGAVYQAVDEKLGREVALKVVSPERARERSTLDRFVREARAAAAVRHPGVVATFDLRETESGLAIVQELVPGRSLQERLSEGPLAWREVARFGAQIAAALAAMHAAGVLHRDLKPANVLLDGQGAARVTDFGLACFTREDASRITATGEVVGTFEYLAPESAGERSEIGPAVDLYSLGATLYALLAGRPPFEGKGYTLIHRHLTETPVPVVERAPATPPALSELVTRLLSKQPSERGTALDVARELETIVAGRAARARVPAARGSTPLVLALTAMIAAAIGWGGARLSAPVPVAPVPVAPVPVPPVQALEVPVASPDGTRVPAWFEALDPDARPPLPLPAGLAFGLAPGEYVNATDGSVLVFVPAGTFVLGIELTAKEKEATAAAFPPSEVRQGAFFIGKYEVSVGQFQRFVSAKGYTTRAEQGPPFRTYDLQAFGVNQPATGLSWKNPGRGITVRDHDAVTQVGWHDAKSYCEWAGLALPTETQWERAASWGPEGKRRFAWGDAPPGTGARPVANLCDEILARHVRAQGATPDAVIAGYDDGFATTAPVNSFPEGAAPCGALNLSGNVSEWCADSPADDARFRSVRGVSFAQFALWMPVAMRMRATEDQARVDLGFRVARALDR